MSSYHKALVAHSTKGRLRLKVPSRKGDLEFFRQIIDTLAGYDTILKVEANALTGSLLILFEGDFKELLNLLETKCLLKVDLSSDRPQALRDCLVDTYRRLNGHLERISSKHLDIATLMAIIFLALGLKELIKGSFSSPPWYVALMSALTLLKGAK